MSVIHNNHAQMENINVLELYFQYRKALGHTPYTLKCERFRLIQYINHSFEKWPDLFFKHLERLAPYTACTRHTTVSTFFKWMFNNGFIPENYFNKVPKPKKPKLLPKTLNKDQAHKLLLTAGKIDIQSYSIYSTFLRAGLRKGELLDLQTYNIDLSNGSIFINQGKGRKDRVIPLSTDLCATLREWERRKRPHNYFFTVSEASLRRIKSNVQTESGVKHTLHQLRHTFASLSLQSGMDLLTLQKILGHSDISTTAVYLGTSVEHMKSQVDKLSFI